MEKENLAVLPQCLAHNTDSANVYGVEGTKERRNGERERVPVPKFLAVVHSAAQTQSLEQTSFSGK